MTLSNIRAKKSLGQNFLSNPVVLDKIIAAAELNKDDIILEIGPGRGDLTEKLSGKAGRVMAIEKDHRIIDGLRDKFKDTNVEIIEGDILKLGIENLKFKESNYKVIGNIPYYITSNLLRTIFEKWPRPKLILLMVQKEVAQRIVARPPDMNLLALSVQIYSEPKIVSYVSRGSFRPIPKVDSAIIKLIPRERQRKIGDIFFKVTKAGFLGKRKQLINNLSKNLGLSKEQASETLRKAGLDEKIRAENLSLEQWGKLSELMQEYLS